MKIVIWKDGTWKAVNGPTWEYENDADWLVTVPLADAMASLIV